MPLVRRDDSALVVVDAQPGFFAPSETLGEEDSGRAIAAVARITWMAGLAALLGIPVVVVEEDPERNGATDPGILERLPPGTPQITKPTFGLAAHEEAVTAIGLLELGFRTVMLVDAAYTSGALDHERGIARMTDAGVERNHCKGLSFEWLDTVDRALEDFPAAAALGAPPWRLEPLGPP